MFSKFLLASLLAAAAAKSIDLETYSFEKFVEDFKLKYKPEELATRKQAFAAELLRVKAHNAQNKGWTETINKFSAMTHGEKKAIKGRVASGSKKLMAGAKPLPDNFVMQPLSALPKSVDWRKKGVATPVKDQGYCGSCWAFASTAVIESHVAMATGLLFDLSPEQIAMCAPNPDSCGGTGGCNGATAELAFEYVSSSAGMFEEFQYPYTSYYGSNYDCATPTETSPVSTINGYVKLPENNYTALMNAIATVGPIAISVDASAWSPYESGVFSGCNQAQPDIDHAVVLMGYGEENGQKYWLVRNSWSPAWGEQGYIKLLRHSNEEEVCGMDTTPTDGTACNGDMTPVKVCGTCGILYDSSYPLNAAVL